MAEMKTEVISERKKTEIKRERIRRALMHTKPGETICLQYEEAQLILDWLKETQNRKERFIL